MDERQVIRLRVGAFFFGGTGVLDIPHSFQATILCMVTSLQIVRCAIKYEKVSFLPPDVTWRASYREKTSWLLSMRSFLLPV